jgi:DNA-binding response OmpR family regulator
VAALILIVEDDETVTAALRILFEDAGYRVSSAMTVRDAVAACVGERPDVMLLDLTLPDGDGLRVLAETSALGVAPKMTAAFTGHEDRATVERCLRAGCAEVLVKPVPIARLLEKVRALGAP